MRSFYSLALAATLALAPVAGAQLAATVPSEDPVYGLLTEVADALGSRSLVVGQRVLSRREITRVAMMLESELDRRDADHTRDPVSPRVRRVLLRILQAYAPEASALRDSSGSTRVSDAPLESIQLSALGTNSAARRVPSNGLGGIDAFTNPLTDGRWGRPLANDGVTGDLETGHRIGIGSSIALGAQLRASLLAPRAGGRTFNAAVQRLYVRGVWHNAALEVGPDEYLWGLGGDRGLLLSANPPPLHSATLSTDTAITLPWVLRFIGPMRASALVADLGQNRNFPGAKLFGYHLDAMLTSRLEMGGGMLVQMGGRGAPQASRTSQIATLFPYVFWIVAPGKDTISAQHIAAGELRYRLSESRGVVGFYEMDLTDFDLRRVKSIFTQNATHLLGLSVERLSEDGAWSANAEFHQTSLFQAEHYRYTSGMTYHQAIIGEPLGPNAKAGDATLTWRPDVLDALSFSGAIESRDPSPYRTTSSSGTPKIVKMSQSSVESRERLIVSLSHSALSSGASICFSVGAERTRNASFVAGQAATNYLAELMWRIAP